MGEGGDGDGLVSASEQAIAAAVGRPGPPARFARLERALAWVTEIPAAVLVAVEILVLLVGVISRYVFNSPLTWSDELASILFLWLAMLGSVIALRRGEHMRLGFLVGLAPPRWRQWLETFATMVVAVFLVAMIAPARDYVEVQWLITTPALEIRDGYRVAAIEVGAALMLLIAVARLIERATLVGAVTALAAVLAIGVRAVAGAAVPRRNRQLQSRDLLRRNGRTVRRARACRSPSHSASRPFPISR